MAGIYSNTVSSNKNHGIRIEYTTGGIWIRGNQVVSKQKLWHYALESEKYLEVPETRLEKYKKGMYIMEQ